MPNRRRNFESMSRRRFTKTLLGMGVSAATVSTLTQESLAELTDRPEKEVPIVAGYRHKYPDTIHQPPEIEPIFETVPQDRWAKIQAAQDAQRRLQETTNKFNDQVNPVIKFKSSSKNNIDIDMVIKRRTQKEISWGTNGVNHKTVRTPEASREAVEQTVPSKVIGQHSSKKGLEKFEFSVHVENETQRQQFDWFNYEYRPIPGGCRIDGGGGTLLFSLWDRDYNRRMLASSGHVVENSSQIEQPGWPDSIGYPIWSKTTVEGDFDCGIIDTENAGVEHKIDLADFGGTYEDDVLANTRAWDWISSKGQYTSIIHQGTSTGRPSGNVVELTKKSEEKFYTDAETNTGDSGGPHYQDAGGEYYIVGIHNWEGGGDAGANGIERVQERMNVLV